MKLKATNKPQQASPEKKPKTKGRPVWEMSAQAALRVNYLSHRRSI